MSTTVSTCAEQALRDDARDLDRRRLEKHAAAALLQPVDEALVVLLEQEAQARAELGGAPEQRHDLLGRVLDELQVRADQVERGEQVGIDLLVVLAEGVAAGEGDAAVGLAEQVEELRRDFFQALQDAVELRRAELLHAAHDRDVAAQVLDPVVAHGHAEILPGDVLDLVRFVEDHRVIRGKNAALVARRRAARGRRRRGDG